MIERENDFDDAAAAACLAAPAIVDAIATIEYPCTLAIAVAA